MTDRLHSLTVVLEANLRVDDAEALMAAIRCLRGVLEVTGVVASLDSHMAEVRARRRLVVQLEDFLDPEQDRDR